VQRRLIFRLVSAGEPEVNRPPVYGLLVPGPKVRALLPLRSHGESSGRAAVSDSFRGSPFFGVSWGEAVFIGFFMAFPFLFFGSQRRTPEQYHSSKNIAVPGRYIMRPYLTLPVRKRRHNVLFIYRGAAIPQPAAAFRPGLNEFIS
jgi:hypothetical protein